MQKEELKQKVLKANEEIHDYYAKHHARSVPYQSRKVTRDYIWNLIIKQLKENKIEANNAEVLEVACGTGTFVELFQKLKSKSYKGVDISGEMIRIAKDNNKHSNVSFEKISLEDSVEENQNKYDIIIASSFLHHLVDLEAGILQIKKMLKPEGIFIGLHEVINHRKWTKLEMFDHELSFLLGYQGQIVIPFNQRLKSFAMYLFQNQEIFKLIVREDQVKIKLFNKITLWKMKKKENRYKHCLLGFLPLFWTKITEKESLNTEPDVTTCENDINLVDYQLNFDFNLSNNEIANKYGQVIPYCYYNFAEFRYLQQTMNHHLFVMRRSKENIITGEPL